MIDDMIRLTVDPIYPPKNEWDERESLFDLVLNDNHDQPINKRRPFSMDLIYPVAELKQPIGGFNNKKPDAKVRFITN